MRSRFQRAAVLRRRNYPWVWARIISTIATMLLLPAAAELAHGGGPRYVAGVSYFDSGLAGTPVVWGSGALSYFTDQGDLSPALPAAAADAFVADAFSRWTSIRTAAVSTTQAGKLSEDVSAENLFRNADQTITLPPDILPSATEKPIAIVYDADGAVTDALLGSGAGDAANCFTPADGNAVFGGPDNFSSDAHLTHALVIINGSCVQSSTQTSQIADLKYRLVRVLGRVLGLDWSQANLDPSAADAGGFPLMHAYDPATCVPISKCYANADQPKMDDRAALSRLYPVTQANLAAFPNKSLFQPNTVRIHGSVFFVDADGQPAQPMQGVNVVARLVDPVTLLASRTYVASSVSGFRFHGNAGNHITGFTDPASTLRYDRFGSDDPSLEGFYDFDGLEVPDPSGIAEYQISLEPVSSQESQGVGPYAPWQVLPSGRAPTQNVFITLGNDIALDLLMIGSAVSVPDPFGPQSFGTPAQVPGAGDWTGSLNAYGDVDYFQFSGVANRTLSVEATAFDGVQPTQSKALPVIGLWALADAEGPPELASSEVFNGRQTGTTQLKATLSANASYRLGIADYRGDGRPDYHYHARIFYGNQVFPARASVAGGTPLILQGMGFRGNTTVKVGGVESTVLAIAAGKLLVSAPAMADGVQTIGLADPTTGATSEMTGVLTYGAGPGDSIKLVIPSVNVNKAPLGGTVPTPVSVEVVGPDGVTPVAGASVALAGTPAGLSACGGTSACTVFSDQSGMVATQVTIPASVSPGVLASGIAIAAKLAPASYSPPKQVQATVAVSAPPASGAMDIVLSAPFAWVAQGANFDLPLTAEVLSGGVPQSGQVVSYAFLSGSGPGTLSSAAVTTDDSGLAAATLHLAGFATQVQVSACVGSRNTQSCQTLTAIPVAASAMRLQAVAGTVQVAATGATFHPLVVRVIDSASDVVQGATVEFQGVVTQPGGDPGGIWIGDTNINPNPQPVILGSYQIVAQSDTSGIAAIQPPAFEISDAVVSGIATAGVSSTPFNLQVVPALSTASAAGASSKLRVEQGLR